MKRNYLSAGVLAAVAAGMLIPAAAGAKDWSLVGQDASKAAKAKTEQNRAIRESVRRVLGHSGLISPIVEGALPTPSARPSKSIARPIGNFYTVVTQHVMMERADQALYGKLNLASGLITPKYNGSVYINTQEIGELSGIQGGAVRDGILYIPCNPSLYDKHVEWKRVDVSTGEVLPSIQFGQAWEVNAYSLTYDPSADLFFCLSSDSEGNKYGMIATVDPKNDFEVNYINDLPEDSFYAAICYNPADGEIYLIDDFNIFYRMDRETAVLSEVGDLQTDLTLITQGATLPMAYSPKDECFIVSYTDLAGGAFKLAYIDPETLEVTDGAALSVYGSIGRVSALLCDDGYATTDAPEIPDYPTLNFTDGALSGGIKIVAPTTNYGGVALTVPSLKGELMIDEKVFWEGDMAPGAEKEIQATLEQGMHSFSLTFISPDGLRGATRTSRLYIGNDTPVAPSNLLFDGNRISWKAPGAVGTHHGYVSTADLTYNVYFDGELQNKQPLKDTFYEFDLPEDYFARLITVTATSNGMTSAPASINQAFGKPFELPVSWEPIEFEADIFTLWNTDEDAAQFYYDAGSEEGEHGFVYIIGNFNNPDDWVFTPVIKFDDANVMYDLGFGLAGVQLGATNEDLDIYLCEAANPQATLKPIFSRTNLVCERKSRQHNVQFAVDRPGEYVIGFHYVSTKGTGKNVRGIRLNDFSVAATTKSSAIPAAPEFVTVTAAPLGDLTANFDLTVPTEDLIGNPLPADKEIEIRIQAIVPGTAEADDTTETTAKGKPGQKLQMSCDGLEDGVNGFYVSASNDNGSCEPVRYEVYLGIDVPLCPTDIVMTPTEDNMGMHLTWTAPVTGEHGGYIDPENISYNIYSVSGGVQNTQMASKIGTTVKTEFTYISDVVKQRKITLGPSAQNAAGESRNSLFVADYIGAPHELPMSEEFGTTAFDLGSQLYNFETKGDAAGSEWANRGDLSDLFNGACTARNGAIVCYWEGAQTPNAYGHIRLPKFTSKDVDKAAISIRYWDHADCPGIEIWGRRHGQNDMECLGKIEPQRPSGNGEWVDGVLVLPESYNRCGWAQLAIHPTFRGHWGGYLVIDSFKVYQDIEFDLKAHEIEGPDFATIGDNVEYMISASNSGRENNSGSMRAELLAPDGARLDMFETKVPRQLPGAIYSTFCSFNIKGNYSQYDELTLRLTVESENDMLENNNVRELKIKLHKSILPVVTEKNGKWNDTHTGVTLSWAAPETTYGSRDDFERHEPFQLTERIGTFKNIDRDGYRSSPIEGLRFDNDDAVSSWMVFDAEKMSVMGDERIAPHSGKRYLIARAVQYDDESGTEPLQASDWLISPEVVGGTQLSFWISSPNATYTEYVRLYVSSTDDNPESFRFVRPFSKSGSEAWEQCVVTLPEDAKYFALVYCSYNSVAMCLDDVEFTPANLASWEIDHYEIYRTTNDDWNTFTCVAGDLTDTTYTDETVGDVNAQYYIHTYVKDGDRVIGGPRSGAIRMFNSAVAEVSGLEGISSGKGEIIVSGLAGRQIEIYSADARALRNVTVSADLQRFAVAPGIYVVRCGNASAKVIVK